MPKPSRIASACCALVLAGLIGPSALQAEQGPRPAAPEPIVIRGGPCRVAVNPADGSLAAVGQAGMEEALFQSGEQGLWQLKFLDGSTLSAAQFADGQNGRRVECRHEPGSNRVELDFTSPEATVSVTIVGQSTGVELTGRVAPREKVVLDFSLPARLRFDPARLERFVTPVHPHLGVGLALRPSFFQMQPEDKPSGWSHTTVGSKGCQRLFGVGLEMRDLNEPPAPLQVTEEGRQWLGPGLSRRVDGSKANVSRPTPRSKVQLVLIDSPNGPCFGASRLGGKGGLWRWGGFCREEEAGMATDVISATIRRLAAAAPDGKKLGLVQLTHGPHLGGGCQIPAGTWPERLRKVAEATGCQLVELASPAAMLAAAGGDDFVAILNPYGEWLPVPSDSTLPETVDRIGDYVRRGGNWFEVGGYSFYAALEPVRYLGYESPYPPLFADLFQADAAGGGSVAVYRVQPRSWNPWTGATSADDILVPGRFALGSDPDGGWCDRSLGIYVKPGESWQAPPVRLAAGKSPEESLRDYCQANGITRPLRDKMAPEVLDKFRRAVLVKYQGTAREQIDRLGVLPVPTLIHFADYLKGGFDKQYPDHLPPRADYGTPAELREFFDRAHALGHLMMPYTNPTWWCDHPRGPTFEKAGDAPLAVGLDGKHYYERYSANDGWTTTLWHPAVQAANRSTRRQFTEDYPVDILLEDQCGARTWKYDLNPASPTPYAYAEGILSMVDEDSQIVPLSTEDGYDRVVNAESQLCGFTFALVPGRVPAWVRPMKSLYPRDTWELFPVAQIIAHDKAAMVHHDLGKFVVDRPSLSWTLGLGFSMSYSLRARWLDEPRHCQWLRWLDRVQKLVCARYVGEPVVAFKHRQTDGSPDDDGVIQATYGPVRLTANLGPADREASGRLLPGFGFLAAAPGMVAGNVKSLAGTDFGDDGVLFVSEGDPRRAEVWICRAAGSEAGAILPSGMAGEVVVTLDGQPPQNAEVIDGAVHFRLPSTPPDEDAGNRSNAEVPYLWHAEIVVK